MEWVKMKRNFNQTVRKLETALGLFIGAVKSAASKRSADGLTAVPWIQTGNGTGPITQQLLAHKGVSTDTPRSLKKLAPLTNAKINYSVLIKSPKYV